MLKVWCCMVGNGAPSLDCYRSQATECIGILIIDSMCDEYLWDSQGTKYLILLPLRDLTEIGFSGALGSTLSL